MRPMLALLAFAAPVGTAAAQGHWRPEIGVVGGFARIMPAGGGQPRYLDRLELPGTAASYPTVFVVIPLTSRLALEPAIAGSRSAFKEANDLIPATSSINVRVTLRADLAIAKGFYIAAGGLVRFKETDDVNDTQLGALGALGYREELGSRLAARIEFQWVTQRQTDSLVPTNVYAMLLGFSHRLEGRAAAPAAQRDASSERRRPWRPAFGIAGGYVRNHVYGSAFGSDFDAHESFAILPGSGSPVLPALFIVLPLYGRLALETAVGGERTQLPGSTAIDGRLSTRLDLAIYRRGYVAGGGAVLYIAQGGRPGFAFAGANVAAGYRFPLLEGLEGRAEVSFTTFKERQNFPLAQNTLAVLLGVTMGLD
ncbi:MAG TPA: hypothetical protein VGQ18_05315 [Gemmatimonadales bacterium]|nr:hypothetical protein [Gemmatimonadales bacterium]